MRAQITSLRILPRLYLEFSGVLSTGLMRRRAARLKYCLLRVGIIGSFEKILYLGVNDESPSVTAALTHFGMLHEMALRYEIQGTARTWFFNCNTLHREEFKDRIESLTSDEVLPGVLPESMDTEKRKLIAAEHPWGLCSCGPASADGERTWLGTKSKASLTDGLVIASTATILELLAFVPCLTCDKAAGITLDRVATPGLETVIHFRCSEENCCAAGSFRPVEMPTGQLNKIAYAVSEMCDPLIYVKSIY